MRYLLLLLMMSCGDNSPFDEDYWDPSLSLNQQLQTQNATGKLHASLISTSGLVLTEGRIDLDIGETDSTFKIDFSSAPGELVITEVVISTISCNNISVVTPNYNQNLTKEISHIETGDSSSLFRASVAASAMVGQNIIVYGLIRIANVNLAPSVFPVACGTLVNDSTNGLPGSN